MEPIAAGKYQPLGSKTFFMIVFKKSVILLLFLPALVFLFFLLNYVPGDYVNLWSDATSAYLLILIIVILGITGMGWLEYIRYSIFTDEKSLKIRRGLINVEELGIPYRRIKDANIKRSLVDQIFGVSDIVITILDTDDNNNADNHETTIVLPSLQKSFAITIQDMILRRAQVEEINVLGQQKISTGGPN